MDTDKILIVKINSMGESVYNHPFISINECSKINWNKRFGLLLVKDIFGSISVYEIYYRTIEIEDGEEVYSIYLITTFEVNDTPNIISKTWIYYYSLV